LAIPVTMKILFDTIFFFDDIGWFSLNIRHDSDKIFSNNAQGEKCHATKKGNGAYSRAQPFEYPPLSNLK
ncbi:MAG: hypothetical protein V2I56_06255, partial [Desulfobacteraceae bacterium]|nr:hypothetical protein [Desulfobacteraceae bacterium]